MLCRAFSYRRVVLCSRLNPDCESKMPEPAIVMYGKSTCGTCRSLVQLLEAEGVEFERVEYTIDPISRQKLLELLSKMQLSPRELLRTKAPEYRELGLDRDDVSDDVLLNAMAAHPELVQRPIVERGDRAVLARPAEKVRALF